MTSFSTRLLVKENLSIFSRTHEQIKLVKEKLSRKNCSSVRGLRTITISDHYLIYGIRKFQVTKQPPRTIGYRDFKQFNETNFLLKLQSSINLNLDHVNPNNLWLIWKNTFLNIVNKHAPLKKRRVTSKRLPWLNYRDLITKKRQKESLKKNL